MVLGQRYNFASEFVRVCFSQAERGWTVVNREGIAGRLVRCPDFVYTQSLNRFLAQMLLALTRRIKIQQRGAAHFFNHQNIDYCKHILAQGSIL